MGGGVLLLKPDPVPDPVVVVPDNAVAEAQQQVIVQLTDLDLAAEACSSDFLATYGNGLCREMWCRMQSRGIDAQTSGSECEEISNLNNTISILQTCAIVETPEQLAECYQLFRERK